MIDDCRKILNKILTKLGIENDYKQNIRITKENWINNKNDYINILSRILNFYLNIDLEVSKNLVNILCFIDNYPEQNNIIEFYKGNMKLENEHDINYYRELSKDFYQNRRATFTDKELSILMPKLFQRDPPFTEKEKNSIAFSNINSIFN